ncbi:hypothetical protein [Qipengyuania sediminis]|uniref:hypothetical protein n=1 Tax=Qipengyuania sediminis TaxID=1532023 RepID=UPI0010592A4E|nr:hypothetical protein [Qipengyuania sediminis]
MSPPDRTAHPRPIGIFVHHQGRGHAERAADLANELSPLRKVTLFCARGDIFPALRPGVELIVIPSLFEPPPEVPPNLAGVGTPETLHCAPLGWATITEAVAKLTGWMREAAPALFVTDVSAEIGQLCRIASVPHVAVLQHGDRSDPGHGASYDGAVGLLAPYHPKLEQPDRPEAYREKTHYAPGIGISTALPPKAEARRSLGIADNADLVVVVAGGGGTGTPTAPLTLGARSEPATSWVVIGETQSEWHETPPGNLQLLGWVDHAASWIAAADRLVTSCGNTTVHHCLATGSPWVVVPEWRYFAEQHRKAEALAQAGVCATRPVWPSHAGEWDTLWREARGCNPAAGPALLVKEPAAAAAAWLDRLATRLWQPAAPQTAQTVQEPAAP